MSFEERYRAFFDLPGDYTCEDDFITVKSGDDNLQIEIRFFVGEEWERYEKGFSFIYNRTKIIEEFGEDIWNKFPEGGFASDGIPERPVLMRSTARRNICQQGYCTFNISNSVGLSKTWDLADVSQSARTEFQILTVEIEDSLRQEFLNMSSE